MLYWCLFNLQFAQYFNITLKILFIFTLTLLLYDRLLLFKRTIQCIKKVELIKQHWKMWIFNITESLGLHRIVFNIKLFRIHLYLLIKYLSYWHLRYTNKQTKTLRNSKILNMQFENHTYNQTFNCHHCGILNMQCC